MRQGIAGGAVARAVMMAGLLVALPLLILWATGSLGDLALPVLELAAGLAIAALSVMLLAGSV